MMDVPPNHYGICSAGNTRAVPRIKADSGRTLSALDSKDGFKKWAELLSREIGLCPLFFKAGYPHRVLLVAKAFFRKKLEGDFVPFLGRGMFRHPDTQERRSCAVCWSFCGSVCRTPFSSNFRMAASWPIEASTTLVRFAVSQLTFLLISLRISLTMRGE